MGAGPAGSWAARLLARRGVAVAVFDASHPREKACGGGLTARAVSMITRELGRFPVPGVAITAATFESAPGVLGSAHRRRATIPLSARRADGSPALLIVNRDAFDGSLLEAARSAGASTIPERVVDVVVGQTGVTIQTAHGSWNADVVLGADGANSLVRRRVASAFTRAQVSVGAGSYVHGLSSSDITIRWMATPPGYLWSFPRHDRLAVGSCAQYTALRGVSDLKDDVGDWLHGAGVVTSDGRPATPGVVLEPYSWPIPALPAHDLHESLPLAGERWMLLGDAAGLVDPLTREGIFYALHSAACAAEALSAGRPGAAARYRQTVASRILPELRRAAELKDRFFTPAFSDAFVAALSRSRRIRAVVNDLVAGEQPYIGLKRRLLATGRVDLAVRAFAGWWPDESTASI